MTEYSLFAIDLGFFFFGIVNLHWWFSINNSSVLRNKWLIALEAGKIVRDLWHKGGGCEIFLSWFEFCAVVHTVEHLPTHSQYDCLQKNQHYFECNAIPDNHVMDETHELAV